MVAAEAWAAVRRALRPADRGWAVLPALRTVLAVGVCAAVGAATGGFAVLGVMYFGAACAVVFVTAGEYRTRVIALAGQGIGAVLGLGMGAVAATLAGQVAVAAAVALVCGVFGAIGPVFTAGAVMAVIGVAFGQFSGLALPWWQQAGWYLLGTAIVAVPALVPWLLGPRRYERRAIAEVFRASAELLAAIGTEQAHRRRVELAACSATAHAAVLGHRLTVPGRHRDLLVDLAAAQETAVRAATYYHEGRTPPAEVIRAVRAGEHPGHDVVVVIPWRRRVAIAVRGLARRPVLLAGVRLAWCVGIATLLAGAVHPEGHAYWLPLTVAVVVRTEYGTVFVRTVNRIAGTVGGALVAVVALLVFGSGWPVALVAALSIGFAVLAAPKLYALSVVGVTASALLSACIAVEDTVFPLVRVIDTLLGCAVALVFGYLLWPGRHALPAKADLAATARQVVAYLQATVAPDGDRTGYQAMRDETYRVVHETRTAVAAALADPPPLGALAAAALPSAVTLEDATDGITTLRERLVAGAEPPTGDQVRAVMQSVTEWSRPIGHTLDPPATLIRRTLIDQP
ncbi:FUSC family protein [Amycolatopsis sp. FDAARGOS 1241]|uniref:FUSC family protein n=1 Tax=Amycolatopsis sp. FDAARGOS 1241 TaxID=2778070 RepID=UPI00194EE5DB|nr:FUSC family protein [Amycolatopsis sp. FDAARGOS 1241]QRP49047.1 FUSC family protein [Amycolatopsis sp. FDAARGOS 1241]